LPLRLGLVIDTDRSPLRSPSHSNFPETPFLRGPFVNKTELIEHIAKQADISKAAATRALEALIGGVKTTLKKNGSVSIVGFGTFAVSKRASRTGRNPRTGDAIKIKAAKVPKFRPGKALKDHLN
jgi:DNA-binding protein HU-beta